jgi:superfamily I DNA and/or RNA helicase
MDTFQGQEAKIVIISLVRNSGSFEEGQALIGFLKVGSLHHNLTISF